jgi:hypothetical protein
MFGENKMPIEVGLFFIFWLAVAIGLYKLAIAKPKPKSSDFMGKGPGHYVPPVVETGTMPVPETNPLPVIKEPAPVATTTEGVLGTPPAIRTMAVSMDIWFTEPPEIAGWYKTAVLPVAELIKNEHVTASGPPAPYWRWWDGKDWSAGVLASSDEFFAGEMADVKVRADRYLAAVIWTKDTTPFDVPGFTYI